MRLSRTMVVGTALLVAATACASKASTTSGGTTPAASPSAAASSTGPSGGGGYGYGGGPVSTSPPAAAGADTVQQGAGGQLVFAPSSISVARGTKLTISNVGSFPHTFTINGHGIDVTNQPGASQQVTIDLAPGTYTFICRFHVTSGMKGTLTVTG